MNEEKKLFEDNGETAPNFTQEGKELKEKILKALDPLVAEYKNNGYTMDQISIALIASIVSYIDNCKKHGRKKG